MKANEGAEEIWNAVNTARMGQPLPLSTRAATYEVAGYRAWMRYKETYSDDVEAGIALTDGDREVIVRREYVRDIRNPVTNRFERQYYFRYLNRPPSKIEMMKLRLVL